MFEKIYTSFYLKEDHSDEDKLLDEAVSDFVLDKELDDVLDESILDEGFIFNKNKSERIKMSKNPEQVAKVLSKLAESFKEYMDKATHVDKFCRVEILGKNGFTVQPSYPSKLNAQVFYNKLSGYHFPSAISSRSDKDGSFELYGQFSFINGMLIYINYLNDGNPYNANVLFKWVFDSTYGGSIPYTVQQLVKLLGKKYINPAGLSPIALTDRSIGVLVDKGQEEQFKKDALQIFKNPSYDIVFKKNKIIFNKKGLKEAFEEIEKESSLIREDYTLLEEAIKDIFNNIRNAPVTIEKLIKVKQDFQREYNFNIDKHILKYKSDLKDISDLTKNANLEDEKGINSFKASIDKKFLFFLPKLLKEITDDLAEELEIIWDEYDLPDEKENEVLSKTLKALLMNLVPLTINTILDNIFCNLFGLEKGRKITVVCVGPLSEEISKLTAEKFVGHSKHGLSYYNIVFNITEFSTCFFKIYSTFARLEKNPDLPNYKLDKAKLSKDIIKKRIPAIVMHTVNTGLIKLGMKKSEDLGGEIMTMITIIIHSCFNAFAIKQDAKNTMLPSQYDKNK